MLWLALVFPRLPIEAQRERGAASAAGACVVQRGRVLVVDAVAAAAGLAAGMRLSTARGILPEARIVERDANLLAHEVAALDEVACYAGNLSPTVSLEAPHSVLLEVGGCLRLFGGLRPIVQQLLAACDERGLTAVAGIAPTPRAAHWLALAQNGRGLDQAQADRVEQGLSACCLGLEAVPETLADLPVEVLGGDIELRSRLQSFGLRRLGELIALPRAALALRIGPAWVEQLRQALGESPDPRIGFCFPDHFQQAIELPGVVVNAAMLAMPARRLIDDLCGWLAARQRGASACTLTLHAERRGVVPVPLRLALSTPSRDPARFERLLREKLAQIVLPAPVGELVLAAGGACEIVDLPGEAAGLFERRAPQASLEVLVERLRARFGDAAVHALQVCADHRPECATRHAPIGRVSPAATQNALRPLWLLRQPEALPEFNGHPTRHGEVLALLGGPERIESGWWDEGERQGDVRRDYFLASTVSGQQWWIYRDARGWWGQGLELAMRGGPRCPPDPDPKF